MDTIFLQKPTEKLSIKENQLVLQDQGELKEVYPLATIEQVNIYGNSQITTQAVKACLYEGIRIVYFNAYGKFLGRTEPDYPKNICRRLKQYKLVLDPRRRLQWAKSLIEAKIQCQNTQLRRLFEQKYTFPYKEARKKLLQCGKKLAAADSIEEVMGIEGYASKIYYDLFPCFLPENAPLWQGRKKHPATDEANMLLSYIYGCGANRIRSECEKHSLDPHCGFLHEPGYNKGGLIYDLMELIRSSICDHYFFTVMKKSCNKEEQIHIQDFAERKKITEGFEQYLSRKYARQKSSAAFFIKDMLGFYTKALENEEVDPVFHKLLPKR